MRYIHAHIRSHFGSGAQTRRVAMPRPRTAGCLPDAFQEPRRSCSPHLVVGLLPAAHTPLLGCCVGTSLDFEFLDENASE